MWVQSPGACAPNSCTERIVSEARLYVPGAVDRDGNPLLAADLCPRSHNGTHFSLEHGMMCELPCAGGYLTATGSIFCDRGNLRILPCIPKQCIALDLDDAFRSGGFEQMRYEPTDKYGRPVHGSIGTAVCSAGKQPTYAHGVACNATGEGMGTYTLAEVVPEDPKLECEPIPCVGSMADLEGLEGRDVECGTEEDFPWTLGVECKFTAAQGYFFLETASDGEGGETTRKVLSQTLSCDVTTSTDPGATGNVAMWPPLPSPEIVICPPSLDFPNCLNDTVGATCDEDETGQPYKCPPGTAKDGKPAEEGKGITLECAVVPGNRVEGRWRSPCVALSCPAGPNPVSNMADCVTAKGDSMFANGATKEMTHGSSCTVSCVENYKIFKGGSTGLVCRFGELMGVDSAGEVVERLPACEDSRTEFVTVHKVEGSVNFEMNEALIDDLLSPANLEATKAAFAESLAVSLDVDAAKLSIQSLTKTGELRRLAGVLSALLGAAGRRLQSSGLEVKYSIAVDDAEAAAALVTSIEDVNAATITSYATSSLEKAFPEKGIEITGATMSSPRAVEYEETTGEIPGSGAVEEEEAGFTIPAEVYTALYYGALVIPCFLGIGVAFKQFQKRKKKLKAERERLRAEEARRQEDARLALGYGNDLPPAAAEQLEAMEREERMVVAGTHSSQSQLVPAKPANNNAPKAAKPLALPGPARDIQPGRDPGPMTEDEHILQDATEPPEHHTAQLRTQPSWAV
jgi:hypothetical protein